MISRPSDYCITSRKIH